MIISNKNTNLSIINEDNELYLRREIFEEEMQFDIFPNEIPYLINMLTALLNMDTEKEERVDD